MGTLKLLSFWFVFSLVFGCVCGYLGFDIQDNSEALLNILFTASTTMFSVAMGVIVGLSFSEITKRSIRERLTASVKQIKNNLLAMYGTSSTLLIIVTICDPKTLLLGFFNCKVFVIIYIICGLLCFTVSFMHMQKLREDIDAELSRLQQPRTN